MSGARTDRWLAAGAWEKKHPFHGPGWTTDGRPETPFGRRPYRYICPEKFPPEFGNFGWLDHVGEVNGMVWWERFWAKNRLARGGDGGFGYDL